MPKKSAPRPTNTNTGDYLLNFDNVDFSQFGGQQEQPQQEEPGFLSKVGSSAQAIAEGVTMLPGQMADTLRDAYHGGDVDVTDTDAIRERQAREQGRANYGKKYEGKAFEGVTDAMNSMGYSLGTMGASLGAAALASPAGPVAAGAAGMAASGTMAYRATKQQFLQQMLGETEKVLGRLPTQNEWDKIATEFDGEATRYGAWEAGPEALSNLFMAKILGPLGKGLLRGSLGQGIKRVGGLYGEELATETVTQLGQGQEEANVGLRDSAPGVLEAFKEIGPATFWQTTLMAGGKKGADMLANRLRARSQQVENNADQTQGVDATGQANQPALPMAQGILALPQGNGSIPMGSTDTGRGTIAAGVVAGQQPKPFVSDADHADTEAFVRAFEERERQQDDEAALIEYGQRQARSPAQLALDQGENVDLLSLPQGNAAMAMGTEETGRAPIAPPTDYAGQPIATPYTPRPALPEQTSQSAGIGQWAGGRSQLAYGPKSEPQMMQGLGIMPQQSAPVQPQAMPTSAQISNTQAAPRSDTTAAANSLGMPAPQAVPQEAMAPQKPQALPAIVQGLAAAPAQPAPAPTIQDPVRAIQPEQGPASAPAPQNGDNWRAIGKNSRGQEVSEDRNGVRSYVDGGMRISQSVGIIPDHGISFDAPEALYKNGKSEYLTNDEVKTLSGSTGSAESKKPSRLELIRQLPKEVQAEARKLPNSKLLERVRQLSQTTTTSEDQPGVVESSHAKEDEHAEANEGRTSRNEGKAESGIRNPDEASGNQVIGSHEEVHAEPAKGMADGRRAEGALGLHSGTGIERGKHAGRDGAEADRKGNERGRSVADGTRSGDAGLLADSGAGARGVKDYRISPDDHIGEGGKVAKFNDNLSAIRTLKEIEQSGRQATEDEQKALARYIGWGGMPEMFAEGGKADPALTRRRAELRELLSPKEFEEARRSTTNAHYTSPQIITAMWDAIKRMGFKGGKVLEPSMGVGNFIGLMPDDVYKKSHVTGIELDGITARIAKQLYPKQTILSQGFETAKLRDGSFDLAISNVPFGDYKLHDTRYAKHNLFIHDYFITRALDLVRPGGVVAFITTTGSLNSGRSMNMRLLAADKARLLGAIRLPGTSFSKNALTDVTTDILFLQRLGEGETNTSPAWKDVVDTDVVSEKTGKHLRNNEYYSAHPEMMLGQLADDKLYPGRTALKDDGREMPAALDGALKTLPEGVFSGEGLRHEDQKATANVQMQDIKEGQLLLDGKGNIVQVSDGELKPYAADGKKAARIAGMIGVRDALRSNLRAQMNGDEDSIAHSRKALNDAYDLFTRQHGFLNDNANRLAMSEDPDFPLLQALENNYTKGKNGAQSTAEKADIFTRRTIAEPKIIEHAETPQDALHAQLADIGHVDIPGIAKMTGLSEQAVIDDLHGTIFQNPKGNQWETADDYLSGNVRKKLAEAKKAAKKDEKFKENVKALEDVQPQDVPPQDIRVDLGAGWVPSARIEEFAAKILGISSADVSARYSKELAQWSLNVKKSGLSNEYGTPERSALELLNDSLNLKQTKILIDTSDGVIVNKEATIAAREAQRKLREEFSRWILEDEKRAAELARIYNDTYNAMRLYEADGSHLVLPGIADTIEGKPFALRPHQKSAVWRIIQKGNTLVAHAVGAGKTYEMIAAGMEMKRLGMINKPLYVVPNHMLEQWSREFLQAYPAANILVASKADLQKEKRRKFVSRIATGNWDAVVMTHSSFGRIPISVERKEKHIRDQIEQYESALRAENDEKKAGRGRSENRLVKQLEKQKMRLEEKLRALLEDGKNAKDNQVNFEELGVDFMFVDEGHNFKNLSYVTRMQRIAGLPNSHSQRAEDMLLKTQYLDELHPGRSLVFATGTPISNTVAEMYTMTRYVAPHLLRESGLEMFDSWARQFGRTVTGMEISPDGRNFRENTRFSRFTNVPELLTMFRSFADVKTKEDLDLPLPDLKGGKPEVVSVKPSESLTNYVDELVARAEKIRGGSVDPRKDNMLKVTSEGRLAALDMRLIDDTLPADPNGKVARATDNIYDIWKSTSKDRLAQMVFCDLSVPSKQRAKGPKEAENQDQDGEAAKPEASPDDLLAAASRGSFSVYDEIKNNLVDMGVPADEIAFIHDFNGDKAKAQLFKNVRAGKVRVLLGSTAKMGEGTNVQERLVALHHLDAPWKPSAVEQREGRILRQGNKNSEVQIFTYVTENSFDAYMWQLLESKARFVSTSMRNGVTERDMDDISVTELTAAEAKAAATGDKRILEKVGLDNTISRLSVLKREFDRNQWAKGREVAEAKSRLTALTSALAAEKKDSALAATLTGKNFALTLRGKRYTKATDAAAAIVGIVSDKSIPSGAVIGKAGGFDITMWRKATGYGFSLSGESSFSTGDTTSSEGAVTRIVKGASPENSASRIAATEEAIAKTNRRLDGATKWLTNNKSFDRQEELDAAITRSQELDDELGLSASKDASVISNEADSDNDLMASKVNPGEYLPSVDGKKGMRLEDVQAVADKIGKVTKNAAISRVVQSFDELPYSIRERYSDAKNSVEGVFDPRSGVVWMVADNLSDPTRAAEVWAHEQIVHHGLRGLLPADVRKRVLNQLWLGTGGMKNAMVKDIASRYGLSPTSRLQDRQTVMEEVIAALAEKRGQGLLERAEGNLWRRVVAALGRAWNSIVRAVSGRDGSMKLDNIDAMLSALGRHVIDGQTSEVRKDVNDLAYASKSDQGEQIQNDIDAWNSQLDGIASGEANPRAILTVGHTPDVLRKLGAPALNMTMTQAVLKKIGTDGKHGLPDDLVRRLPALLAEPVMVFRSATQADSLVSLVESVYKGMPVLAAIHLDVQRGNIAINEVSSVYGKSNGGLGWVKNEIQAGRRLYADKTKIPAWLREIQEAGGSRRMSGLQLPGAFVLPSDPRGIKILTEKDVVKPAVSADTKPLASLSVQDILNLGGASAAKIADAPEIHHMFRKDDLSLVQSVFNLPHWIAKKAPAFAKVYERQLQRLDERSSALKQSLESVPSIFGKDRLKPADMDSLKKLLWENEGRDAWQIDASGVDKFVTKETLANGRELISVNPEFYREYKKWLDGLEGTKPAKDAMLEIRKSLDEDLVRAHNRMAGMSEMSDDAIREFRQSIGHVPNYFPHHRYGSYFIQAKVGKDVVFRQHFDAANETLAKRKAAQIAAEQKKNYPDAAWMDGKNDRLPDEILGAPIDSEAMEQIIRAATSKIADKDKAAEINELLTSGVADVLKARGWGAHGIQRKGVPGFEREDITRVLYDYKSGLNGWLTKMEAAKDFSEALSGIDARRTPNLWKYTAQYVKDMLRNSDRVDRITGNIKSVAFAWYLGGSIKTAFVNATQNLVVGVPRLQMDVTGGGRLWLDGAQKAIIDRVTGSKGKGLSDEEAKLVHELYGESVITDAFMEEVRGHLQGFTGATLWNKFTKVLGLPMSEVERFNRASLALAAFRAARNGKLKQQAKEKYGVRGEQANYDQAKEFATDVVRDAHFVYGKSNLPEFMRSNTAGRSMASLYTFRTFTHNMIAMWSWALGTQGKGGVGFVAKSLGATMALGGVTALPFYATIMALCQAATGDDDDWTEKLRSWLPKNNLLRDVVCYGTPAMAGVNIGGSLKMETPITNGLAKGKTPKDVLTQSIGDIIGIPYDLLIEKPSKMIEAHSKGNSWRMIEEAMPVAFKSGMQAWRLYTQGQTTMSGRPINDPGTPGARKLSSSEAIGKMLGFQPVSSTKSYDAYAASQHSKLVRDDKLDELTALALKTFDTGDPAGRKEMLKELKEWNARMQKERKPSMLIAPKDVIRRVKARRRENRPTPKNLREKARLQASWN